MCTHLAIELGMPRRTSPPAEVRIAIGYVRCSTDEQTLSPAAQQNALARWCAAHGARLMAVHIDAGVSGGAPLEKRPALLAALEDVRRFKAEALIVAKRDRLARDTLVAAMVERIVEREGARVLAADGTANGDGPEAAMMRGIIDVFASYERAMIKARTKAALGVKRARGERIGQLPFGYRLAADGVHLERDRDEQRVLAEMLRLREAGRSIRAIADQLNALERPARGNRWHATSVARILRRVGVE
jgi:DNA invertase Pin-like site-specific DNA recombinase